MRERERYCMLARSLARARTRSLPDIIINAPPGRARTSGEFAVDNEPSSAEKTSSLFSPFSTDGGRVEKSQPTNDRWPRASRVCDGQSGGIYHGERNVGDETRRGGGRERDATASVEYNKQSAGLHYSTGWKNICRSAWRENIETRESVYAMTSDGRSAGRPFRLSLAILLNATFIYSIVELFIYARARASCALP